MHKTKPKDNKKPQWWSDIDYGYSDVGVDSATVFRGIYKGFNIVVYPVKLIKKGVKGWEYRLSHPKMKEDEWDSGFETSTGGDHAESSEKAKRWAINTINEWNWKEYR